MLLFSSWPPRVLLISYHNGACTSGTAFISILEKLSFAAHFCSHPLNLIQHKSIKLIINPITKNILSSNTLWLGQDFRIQENNPKSLGKIKGNDESGRICV